MGEKEILIQPYFRGVNQIPQVHEQRYIESVKVHEWADGRRIKLP